MEFHSASTMSTTLAKKKQKSILDKVLDVPMKKTSIDK